MLSETLVASTSFAPKASTSLATKDAGILFYTLRPAPSLKSTLKKSSTNTNSLAFSDTHVFAAQADKSVVHVYSRQRNNQEIVVPFPERIRSVKFLEAVGGTGTLVLGTEKGRLILWEVATGRQVSTPQTHLQATTVLSADGTSNHLLSGSDDSNINVWAIPSLLSFTQPDASSTTSQRATPVHTLTNHHGPITALCVGSSTGITTIAVSASEDKTCIVWNVSAGVPLRTYLMGNSVPLSLAIDPADRGFYAGSDDGRVRVIDFFGQKRTENALYDPEIQYTPHHVDDKDVCIAENQELGKALSLDVNFEGDVVYTGHEGGKVISWDISRLRFAAEIADLNAPVTNLTVLPVEGFPDMPKPQVKLSAVVKPKYESTLSGGRGEVREGVPPNYTFTAQFVADLDVPRINALGDVSDAGHSTRALFENDSFPADFLAEGLEELMQWKQNPKANSISVAVQEENLTAPTSNGNTNEEDRLRKENQELWELVNEFRGIQRKTWGKLRALQEEKEVRKTQERERDVEEREASWKKRRVSGLDQEEEDSSGGEIVVAAEDESSEEEDDNEDEDNEDEDEEMEDDT